jgi:3-oxoacyl-[acyl-carrier-protein] synthase-3
VTAVAVRSIIAGTGAYLPARVLSNAELAQTLETSDLWIRERTGIRQRHVAAPAETCAVMATAAGRDALADAAATSADVDAIIVATSTPDQAFPAMALRVQAALGVPAGFGFDVAAACAGFVYALSLAESLIACGKAAGVLVIGAEVYSRILDWTDRSTCVLFGDGAGAAFLRRASSDEAAAGRGILSTHLHAQGNLGDILYVDGAVGLRQRPGTLIMHGREVFRHAVVRLAEVVDEALAANGLDHAAIDWLVPHQANLRIIDAMGRRLHLPPERVVVTVDRHANTSAASIPLALAEARADGRVRTGELVIMEALGGGLTWGSAIVRM